MNHPQPVQRTLATAFAEAGLLDRIVVGIAPRHALNWQPLYTGRLKLTLTDITQKGQLAYLTYDVKMIIDEDGPWTAAAYLADDSTFTGTQHGVDEDGTLCGLQPHEIAVVRNPFYGRKPNDCPACAARLRALAADRHPSGGTS